MSYFKYFPEIEYNINGKKITLNNIFKRFKLRDDFFNDPNKYFEYDIQNGETPEMIADKIYEDPEMAFVILLTNNIHNYFEEWPLDSESLEKYINKKYGVSNKFNIRHYETNENIIVDTKHVSYDRYPVTYSEHEVNLNNKKKKIKLIVSSYIEQIKKELRELSNQ